MKKFYFLILILSLTIFNISLMAESEPNDSCAQSEVIGALEGATSHTITKVTGTIVSTKYDEVNHKPDYDKDYYHFSPAVSGEVKVTFHSSGNMYFWIGNQGCDRGWNISKEFSTTVTKTFRLNANQRVDFRPMCRWGRTYTFDIEFTPDNEPPVSNPKISIANASISEGDSGVKEMTFTLSLDKTSSSVVSVDFATANGSAKAPDDYESKSGTLEFAAGEKSKNLKITVKGDEEAEGNEEFFINLSNPVNATLANAKATGEIIDDDSNPPNPSGFDSEPNNDCAHSEVITELDNADKSVDFHATGSITPNSNGEGSEGRDYYHFTPSVDGKVTIKLTTAKPMWFAISDNGCHTPWEDTTKWNIQRGVSGSVNKTFDVKARQRVDILALSYSNKDYSVDISFEAEGSPPVTKKADLTITKTDKSDPVYTEEMITYNITVSNKGETGAKNITLKDTLPNGVIFQSADGENWSCSENDSVLTCSYDLVLEPDSSSTLSLTVKAPQNEGEITNKVEVSTETEESDLNNNKAEEKTTVLKKSTTIKTFTKTISSSEDDAIEFEMIQGGGYVYTGGKISIDEYLLANDMGIVKNELGKFRIRAGYRFANISIPKSAKITEAYIQFTAQKGDFDIDVTPTNFVILGEDIGNSAPFERGATYDISNRVKTSSNVSWDDIKPWQDEMTYKTPDIKSVIESIMQRSDWSSSNPVTIFIEPAKECMDERECYRRAYDYDRDPQKAPKLVIKYQSDENQSSPASLSIQNASVTEGNEGTKTMEFTLSLDKATESEVKVDFTTKDSSANAGSDYESKNGSVTFGVGETTKKIEITIICDTDVESDEEFEVVLSNISGAVLANNKATGKIINDDSQNPNIADIEPNNDCSTRVLLSSLDNSQSAASLNTSGTIRPNSQGEGSEGRDYYHFRAGDNGTVTITLKADKPMWFAISDKGCFTPWVDKTGWNIQRGVTADVTKTFNVQKGDDINILALSYSNKDYTMDISFTPKQ